MIFFAAQDFKGVRKASGTGFTYLDDIQLELVAEKANSLLTERLKAAIEVVASTEQSPPCATWHTKESVINEWAVTHRAKLLCVTDINSPWPWEKKE